MWIFLLLLCSLLVSVKTQEDCQIADNTDPCKRFNSREIPYLDTRHPDISFSTETTDVNKFCDLFALRSRIWYISDYAISTKCVQQESCGSRLPIWLNGTMPSLEDEIVNGNGCLRSYEECCGHTYQLKIKNCGFYYVYCFIDLPSGCPQRYCFDIDRSRVTTTTTTTSTTSTTTAKMTTETNKTHAEGLFSNDGKKSTDGVVITLALVTAVSVTAVVVLVGVSFMLKKKLASNIMPQKY